ncbi:MAG: 3-ketoacyl-ACP reductase [Phycisphaeraceae bacterium]|nr:3-ketoacyl-ACP reductase [Phycisphaeraceae bacterium]
MRHETQAGRVALVTGASRGIGRAIAAKLGAEGFGVAVNCASNVEAGQQTAKLVEDAGGRAVVIQADIGKAEDRQRLVQQTIDQLGPISLLVNNAGVAPKVRADLLETSEDSYDFVLDTNLKGPFFLTQMVARHMMAQPTRDAGEPRQAIVNVTSISAYAISVNRGEYCISKAGLSMMTQLFAARLAKEGIQVFEIRPGVIETDMTGPVKAKYDKLIFEDDLLPMPRWGQPDDIANAVVAIARCLLPYSTGQVLDVDGGFHLRRL